MNSTHKKNRPADHPLVSVLTAVYNNASVIEDAIISVRSQSYPNLEHIIVDGGSTDGTKEILQKYKLSIDVCLSEPDNGLYDALNKSIRSARGEYIVFLHSDDVFHSKESISNLVTEAIRSNAELCLSNVVITDTNMTRVIRFYPPYKPTKWLFRIGCMPPHTGCLFKRSLHDEFGYYTTKYRIAGDFDFLVRMFFTRPIRWSRITTTTTRMRRGGKSNAGLASKVDIINEVHEVLKAHKIYSTRLMQLLRYCVRIFEFLPRKNVCLCRQDLFGCEISRK